MNYEIMINKALEILNCSIDDLEQKIIKDYDVVYYRNTKRGGGAVIMARDGEMLYVNPFFVNYEEHLARFVKGERSRFE